jgi:tetratricopeptide (TPR) repeat protein
MSHVFISYSTRDHTYANRLAEKLRTEGFNVWIDNARLRSSEDWWRSIVLAIDTCAAFLAVLTPHSDQSKWVQREITLADQRNKPIFPLLLSGDVNTPNWALFVRTQYEDVRSGQLPGPEFYDNLAQYLPRQRSKGQNIASRQLPERMFIKSDPVLQAALEHPPPREKKSRRSSTVVRLVLLLLIVGTLATYVAISDESPLPLPEDNPSSFSAEQHFLLGDEAASRSDYDTAIEEFTLAIEQGFTPVAAALTLRGDTYRDSGNPVAALADYDAALEDDPTFFAAHMGRGHVFADDQPYRAIDNFTAAHEHASNDDERFMAIEAAGLVFHYAGDYDPAIENFSAALGLSRAREDEAYIHYALGRSFLGRARPDDIPEAIAHLEQATMLVQFFPEAYRELGQAFEAVGNPEGALQAYLTYLEQNDGEVEDWVIRRIEELEQIVEGPTG